MRKCKRGRHYAANIYDREPVGGYARMVRSCCYCNEVMPLGHSDEQQVRDEIIAAETALEPDAERLLGERTWCLLGGRPHCDDEHGCDGCDVWELARDIYLHDTTHNGGMP